MESTLGSLGNGCGKDVFWGDSFYGEGDTVEDPWVVGNFNDFCSCLGLSMVGLRKKLLNC